MLVVNICGYNFSFTDKRTKKEIIIPSNGKSYIIPDYSPTNFRELRYLNVTPIKNEKKLYIDVDLSKLNNKKDIYNVDDIREEFKEEIKMIDDEEESSTKKKPTKKVTKKKSTEKKPLAGKRISVKKRKELLDKYSNNE